MGKPRPPYRAVQHEWVTLDEWEQVEAWNQGARFREDALRDGRHDKPGIEDPDRKQAVGHLPERAVAKHLSIYPDTQSLRFTTKADLPHEIEAKLCGVSWYGLRIDPKYPDHRRVVGVVIERGNDPRGNAPCPWVIPGWCFASDGKRLAQEWDLSPGALSRPPVVIAVPQQWLRAMEGLREIIRGADPEDVAARWPLGSNGGIPDLVEYEPESEEPIEQQIALF